MKKQISTLTRSEKNIQYEIKEGVWEIIWNKTEFRISEDDVKISLRALHQDMLLLLRR